MFSINVFLANCKCFLFCILRVLLSSEKNDTIISKSGCIISTEKELWEIIMNYTYILECSDGTFYTGWTNSLEKRLKAHNQGKGAKYTKTRRPVKLLYYECFDTKKEAMSRECQIKKMKRREKENLMRKNGIQENSRRSF